MAVNFSVRGRSELTRRIRSDVSQGMRNTMSPELDIETDMHSPNMDKSPYRRKTLNGELSPNDTPRKNKRKLSEPKRRTTDFSIKRLCPDSPGSVCSDSGRSEESTSERVGEDVRDSPSERVPSIHSDIKPPYGFPDMRHHPYFIPQFYYQRFTDPLNPYTASNIRQHHGVPSATNLSQNNVGKLPSHPVSTVRYHSEEGGLHENNSSSSKTPSEPDLQKNNGDQNESDSDDESSKDGSGKKCRKNYKNMTRERRVEANARERSRVHTISAAFDGLRRAVPSYSYNQKLSKLAILRIACSYINALSKLTSDDDTPSVGDKMSFGECVDHCTQTIQTEGKARRRH